MASAANATATAICERDVQIVYMCLSEKPTSVTDEIMRARIFRTLNCSQFSHGIFSATECNGKSIFGFEIHATKNRMNPKILSHLRCEISTGDLLLLFNICEGICRQQNDARTSKLSSSFSHCCLTKLSTLHANTVNQINSRSKL